MTVTLLTSQSVPTTTDADALVTGVFQGQDGPVLTLSTDEIDLMAALTALGATGKAEELTKIPTGGQLPAPRYRRRRPGPGAGCGRRSPGLPGAAAPRRRGRRPRPDRRRPGIEGTGERVAVALPGEPDEAEGVALGALLGGYAFRKSRTASAAPGDVELIVHTAHDDAADWARVIAGAMPPSSRLVNTSPAYMVPADLAVRRAGGRGAWPERAGARHENELAKEGFGGI